MLTIKEALVRATPWLTERGSPSARLDAELLLGHILGMERLELYLAWDRPLNEDEKAKFRETLRRRGDHEPVAYIIGKKEFFGLTFKVTPDVLIPRQETELLVEKISELFRANRVHRILASRSVESDDEAPRGFRIADVGTGSGAIAIALAREISSARITATDMSEAALSVARENAKTLDAENSIEFRNTHLLDGVDEAFDIIVSNPPYIPETDRDSLPPDVVNYEPSQALFAGEDGLAIIRELISQAAEKLRPEGWLLMEIGQGQSDAVTDLIFRNGNFSDPPEIIQDYQKFDRIVCARRLAN